MTTKLDNKIQEMFSKLPKEYRIAVSKVNIESKVDKISDQYELSEDETVRLDREVTYLVLHLQNTAKFMLRLEDKLGWSEDKLADITKSVTEKIVRPLQNKIAANENLDESKIPVPKPPSQDNNTPPTPDYGGGSDPYREPPE
jgi:phage-related tail protein